MTVRLASSSSPAISIVGCPSLKLGSTKYGLPMMLNALTTLASGNARWTRSPSESSPLIESFGGKPPEKSSGFIASITTLPAKLAGPHRRSPAPPRHRERPSARSSLPAAASANVPAWIPAPSVDSHSRSSGVLRVARPDRHLMATFPEPGGQAPPDLARSQHADPGLRQSVHHRRSSRQWCNRIYRRASRLLI